VVTEISDPSLKVHTVVNRRQGRLRQVPGKHQDIADILEVVRIIIDVTGTVIGIVPAATELALTGIVDAVRIGVTQTGRLIGFWLTALSNTADRI
jgi:hypothetical protein